MSDKLAQLQTALDKLSPVEAQALARAVELQRAMGQEKLPTEAILSALRSHLQVLRPARVPTLRRLVCKGFEEFLTDQEHDPRSPGLIPRAVLAPWWRGLSRVAGPGIAAFESRLRSLVVENDTAGIDVLEREAQLAAAGWTTALIAELKRPKGDPAVKQLFARPLFLTDLDELGAILSVAQPLNAAIGEIVNVLEDTRRMDGRLINELNPESVTAAKQWYLALNENYGMSSRFLGLALLNRLKQPWHVLRIGRALSWKPNDALVRDTEFGIIGQRLIYDLQRLSRDIVATAEGRRDINVSDLAHRVGIYMDECEGLLSEFGFRRESDWGEAILGSRVAVSAALSRIFLDTIARRILNLMPKTKRGSRNFGEVPDLDAEPGPDVIADALDAAKFLVMLLQRGQRHGFSHAARETIDQLGDDVEDEVVNLLGELKLAPDNTAIGAQLAAVVQASNILFDDGRGTLILRRLSLARRASP